MGSAAGEKIDVESVVNELKDGGLTTEDVQKAVREAESEGEAIIAKLSDLKKADDGDASSAQAEPAQKPKEDEIRETIEIVPSGDDSKKSQVRLV